MKAAIKLLIVLAFFSSCEKKLEQNDSNDSDNIESRFTHLDTVYISSDSLVELFELKDDYNKIVSERIEFFSNEVLNPDSTYHFYLINENDSRFISQFGADDYYLWYTYFLKKKYPSSSYENDRKRLIDLYYTINKIVSNLAGGGTFFAHNIPRIHAYVEWDIYNNCILNTSNDSMADSLFHEALEDYKTQNKLLLEKVFSSDRWSQIPQNNQLAEKQSIERIFDHLYSRIENEFHLKCVLNFQDKFSHLF